MSRRSRPLRPWEVLAVVLGVGLASVLVIAGLAVVAVSVLVVSGVNFTWGNK